MHTRTLRGSTMALNLLLVLCSCAFQAAGQTANEVDETTGAIIWGKLAPDSPYKTTDYVAEDGGLDPYYDLAVSFIGSSLPKKLPVATVKDIIDGKASIGDEWQDLTKSFVGYALCIVIGLLFILIFPIVACCFCCCRLCGNCGGKRIQVQRPNDGVKRIVFAVILAILSLFVIAGAACTFATSDQFNENLSGLNDSVSDAVDDFKTFVDNINNQFTRLGDTNYNFMSTVLQNYVGNASSEVSKRIIAAINNAVNMDAKLNEISTLSGEAVVLVDQLSGQLDTLETQRNTTKANLEAINTVAPCSGCLDPRITVLTNLDFTSMRTQLNTFKTQVTTDVFTKMKNDLDTAIATEVNDATSSLDVATKLNDIFNGQIKPMLGQVDKLKLSLNNDSAHYQTTVDDFVQLVKPYEKYRWYAGLALACFLLLIAVLMLVGVALGVFCGSAKTKPMERSSASNWGGILLMSAVGLIFIFGSLLMLLTTLMYVFGAVTERYVCQSIDNLDKIEEYTSTFNLGVDLKNISFKINGQTISVSVSKLMNGCENDETLYSVLGLSGVVNESLAEIESYKTNLGTINNINASAAAGSTSGSVNISSEVANLQATVASIGTLKTSITSMKTTLTSEKNQAETDSAGAGVHYDPMLETLTSMETTANNLQVKAQGVSTAAGELPTLMTQADTKLSDKTFMENLIGNETKSFVDTIFGFMDSYIGDIKSKLAYDVGKCTPFYSITNAIFGEAFCHGIVDPLNGFWLALGWCIFFFMPSLVLAVKLAKHYRIMLYDEDYDFTVGIEPSAPPPYSTEASGHPGKPSIFRPMSGPNNKVAPF